MLRLLAAALALAPLAATAQTADAPAEYAFGDPVASTQGRGGPAVGFTLNAGVSYAPEYFGADDGEARPAFGGELNYLRLGGFTFGDPDPLFRPEGLGIIGSFRYVGDRDDDDSPELEGLDDVDASLEVGGGLRYATRAFEAFRRPALRRDRAQRVRGRGRRRRAGAADGPPVAPRRAAAALRRRRLREHLFRRERRGGPRLCVGLRSVRSRRGASSPPGSSSARPTR